MLKQFLSKLFGRQEQLDPILLAPRSPKWRDVRDRFLIDNGSICAVCGKIKNLNVHHIIPVHVDKSLELETSNLITLCENRTLNCHLWVGHIGNYSSYNIDVVSDAAKILEKIKNRPYKLGA